MHRTIWNGLLTFMVPALFVLLLSGACKKTQVAADPDPQGGELWLKGSVVNALTHAGIANATVYFDGTTSLRTDAKGEYSINCGSRSPGIYPVRVTADGYGYGFAEATVAKSAAMVNLILLKPLSDPASIGPAGGSIQAPDAESLQPAGSVELFFPAGSLPATIPVSVTRLTGNEVPGSAPAGSLNACTVIIGPATLVANQDLDLSLPLPFSNPAVTTLPLLSYDFSTNAWTTTGIDALVDLPSGRALVRITRAGTYSLAVPGSYSETEGAAGTASVAELDPWRSTVNLTWLAQAAFPVVPATISAVYLKNIASQNTMLHGSRTSFSDSTSCIFNYIGSKPDSLAPVKSNAAGYYRWVPRVSRTPWFLPVAIAIHDVSAAGTITKELFTDASTWKYVHDQGGGGK